MSHESHDNRHKHIPEYTLDPEFDDVWQFSHFAESEWSEVSWDNNNRDHNGHAGEGGCNRSSPDGKWCADYIEIKVSLGDSQRLRFQPALRLRPLHNSSRFS